MYLEMFRQLGVAIILSSLIGLEREQKSQKYGYTAFGGIRTFALIGLLGALAYILSDFSIIISSILTTGVFVLIISSYLMIHKQRGRVGATSEMASIIVYIIGILSAMNEFVLATSIALTTLLILHFKEPLHNWAKHIKNEELISTVEFIIIAFVVLPLLPNKEYGPYGFFNPYLVWLMIVFISGISYLSYILMKFLGVRKGIGLTGFLAGFISSTALTLSFSHESKKNKNIINPYAFAVVIAGTAMFLRILIEVFVVNSDLFYDLLIPMTVMASVGIIFVFYFWIKKDPSSSKINNKSIKLKNPFSLMPALKFGIFFALMMFLTKFASSEMGDRGIYAASLISGILDVDAITLSVSNLAKEGLSHTTSVFAIIFAAMMNTFVKGLIFAIFGNKKVALKVGFVFILMLIAGAILTAFL